MALNPTLAPASTTEAEVEHDRRNDFVDEDDAEDWDDFEEIDFEEDNAPSKGRYLFKVELQNSPSPVWRRLVLFDNFTLAVLNDDILDAFAIDRDDEMSMRFYQGDNFQKTLSIVTFNYGADPNPTLRQVVQLGMPFGYSVDTSDYADRRLRFLIKVENFIHNDSEQPADLVMEQGNIDDDIPERFFLLKVELLDFEPQIWRRVLISNKKRFSDLHYEIQREFGWHDDSLAGFFAGKGYRGEICRSEDCSDSFIPDPKLYSYLREGLSFGYIFNFNDNWQHWLTVEKVVSDKSELPATLIWAKGDNVLPY